MSLDITACIENLVSYEDIAEMFGVQKATTWRWRSTGVLPPETGMIGGRPVWTREVIAQWAETTGRTMLY